MATLIVLFERTPPLELVGEVMRSAGTTWTLTGAETGEVRAGDLLAGVELSSAPASGAALLEAVSLSAWGGARLAMERHRAHARVTLLAIGDAQEPGESGSAAGGHDEPVLRMTALSQIAAALLELPWALALFDEDGHVVSDAAEARRRLAMARGAPPVELWVGLRSFELADARGWFLDTVGMAQLGLPDLEAYAGDGAASAQVSAWLRNVSLYLVQEEAGPRLRHGDTLDGPDEQPWETTEDVSTVEPRRPVLRFAPLARRD